jgi:hypothetical protein
MDAASSAQGLRQLRKCGFVLQRTLPKVEAEGGLHQNAEEAACVLLGVPLGTRSLDITEVAKTLLQNAGSSGSGNPSEASRFDEATAHEIELLADGLRTLQVTATDAALVEGPIGPA